MRELFVYYKVRPGMAELARSAVVAMQRELCIEHDRLEARLLRRSDEMPQDETWMETYASRLDGNGPWAPVIDDALEARIAEAATALLPFIVGERHVERFEALGPP